MRHDVDLSTREELIRVRTKKNVEINEEELLKQTTIKTAAILSILNKLKEKSITISLIEELPLYLRLQDLEEENRVLSLLTDQEVLEHQWQGLCRISVSTQILESLLNEEKNTDNLFSDLSACNRFLINLLSIGKQTCKNEDIISLKVGRDNSIKAIY